MVQPLIAWKPFPVNGMKFVDPNQVLNWQKGTGTIFNTVYFGESFDTVSNTAVGGYMTVTPPYKPGTLKLNTTYYWRVDEFVPPAARKGEVWSFTTRGTDGGVTARYFKGKDGLRYPRTDSNRSHDQPHLDRRGRCRLADGVSARWTANLEAPFSETFTFTTTSDDGVRLWLDGRLIIDNWTDHGSTDNSAKVNLVAGQIYSLRMEWYENTGGATAKLFWESPTLARQIVPQGWLQLPLRAAGPSPVNGTPHAPQTSVLQWIPGEQATGHDVYFGTDATALANADPQTADIYRGRQAADATSFDPGALDWGKTIIGGWTRSTPRTPPVRGKGSSGALRRPISWSSRTSRATPTTRAAGFTRLGPMAWPTTAAALWSGTSRSPSPNRRLCTRACSRCRWTTTM